jgi:hypothetical protein
MVKFNVKEKNKDRKPKIDARKWGVRCEKRKDQGPRSGSKTS